MLGVFSSGPSTVLITEGDSWAGFYAAMAALTTRTKYFKTVVCAVRNRNKDLVKQIEKHGGEIREYNPEDLSSLESTMKGVDAVLLIPVHERDTVDLTRNVILAAEKSQHVKYLLLWSSLGAAFAHGASVEGHKEIYQKYVELEKLVKESNIEHELVIRNGFVVQMFFAFSEIMQNKGVFPLTTSTGRMAPVNAKDIALASITLLSDAKMFSQYNKQTLSFTGPHSYTGPEMTEVLNRTLNTHIEFQEVTLEQMVKILKRNDSADPFDVCLGLAWLELLNEGKTDIVTHDLATVLGRSPQNVEEFFRENQDAFRPTYHMERNALLDFKLH